MNPIKVYKLFREFGIKGILSILKRKVYVKLYIYVVDLVNIIDHAENRNFDLVSMNIEILNDMYNQYKDEISKRKYDTLKKRLYNLSTSKGYVVVDKDENMYGYYYIDFKENLETSASPLISDKPSNIYLFSDYTFINKRGKGAHKFSIYRRLKIGKELGFKTATASIEPGNIYSEKSYYSLGFRKYKEVQRYNFKFIKKTVTKELYQ